MKKNLMSVLILALVLANLILTAILMISVVPQTKKANELITKVCSAIDLEIQSGTSGNLKVPVEQVETVQIVTSDTPMTVNLKDSADGTTGHFAVISVSLALDTKHDDYKDAATVTAKADLIKDEIRRVVSSHTLEDMKSDTQGVKEEILKSLQKMFGSDYIVSIAFPTYNYQ